MTTEEYREHVAERNAFVRRMYDAGWPDPAASMRGLDLETASKMRQAHLKVIEHIATKVVLDYLYESEVLRLGACAKDNLPRALFLLGEISEGGPDSTLGQWRIPWPVDKNRED